MPTKAVKLLPLGVLSCKEEWLMQLNIPCKLRFINSSSSQLTCC
jgi:hypothetical protein